jgi:hypothetical protein
MLLPIPQDPSVEIFESVAVAHGIHGRFTLAVNFETGILPTRDIPWWASDFYLRRVTATPASSKLIDTKTSADTRVVVSLITSDKDKSLLLGAASTQAQQRETIMSRYRR